MVFKRNQLPLLLILAYVQNGTADYTCLSDRDGISQTILHTVSDCPCPCKRYLRNVQRNQCMHCDHFHGTTTEAWEQYL